MGVFARGVCSCGCLRVCLCALVWGWWGSVVVSAFLLCCGFVGVCAVLCVCWVGGGQVGAGHDCPAPMAWCVVPGCCVRGGWCGVWGVRGVLTLVRARREAGGGPRGVGCGGLVGAGGVCFLVCAFGVYSSSW